MPKRSWMVLILIVVLGFVIRVVHIAHFPPSLNWDEVSLGYNAYSLLKSGRDEWGNVLPTLFRAYGDYKLPGYVYASVVPVRLLGLNEVSIRLASIISGTLLILIGFVLGTRVFKSWSKGLFLALLICLSPWVWFLSRVAVEANFALLLVTLGVTLIIFRKITWGIIFLSLSAWTYNSARVFVPLFLLGYFILNIKHHTLKFQHYVSTASLLILLGIQFLSPVGLARYESLKILDTGAIDRINQLQQLPGGRLIYNKLTYLGVQVAKNYFSHFSPQFLFIKGGDHYQFNVVNHGLIYVIFLPFFYIGLYLIGKKGKLHNYQIILLWLVLAAVPGSLTRDAPHPLRAILLLLPLLLIIGISVVSYWDRFGKWAMTALIILLLVSAGFYIDQSLTAYRVNYSWAWQYGHSQTVDYIKSHYLDYDQIIFTKRYGEPHEFVLFYWPWDPTDYQSTPTKDWNYHDNWYWIDGFAKFRFVNDWEMGDMVAKLPLGYKYLVVSSPDHESVGKELFRTNFLDGKPAFIIKEVVL